MEAFVYMWQDIGVEPNKFYIGRKMGDYWKISAANSYQTSSKLVACEMEQRPNDFRRFLIDCGSKEEMILVETELLKSVDAAKNPLYYNGHNNDKGYYRDLTGVPCSEERKRKIGLANSIKLKGKKQSVEQIQKRIATSKLRGSKVGHPKGKLLSEEHKRKLSEIRKGENHPMFGKHYSEESKQKNREAHLGKRKGKNHPMYGKHHSEESKQKNSVAHLGKSSSSKGKIRLDMLGEKNPAKRLEVREKISKSLIGRPYQPLTPDGRKNLSIAVKKIWEERRAGIRPMPVY